MNAVFAELCTRFHGSPIGFISIEAEQVAELSERFSIEAVPTFVFVDETGKELERVAGADAAKLTRSVEAFAKQALLKEGIQQPATNTQTTASGRDDLNKRLVELTTMAPVVLFMKGNISDI